MSDKILEKIRQEVESQKRRESGSNLNWLRFPKDDEFEMRVRILPHPTYNTDDPQVFYVRFGVHWINKQKFYCPRENHGNDCPACAAVSVLYDQGMDDKARYLRVSRRALIQVVNVLGEGQYEDQPMLLEISKSLIDTIVNYCMDPDYGDISDPETGTDFKIVRTVGENGILSYSNSRPVRKSTAIPKDTFANIMSKAVDVFEVARGFATDIDALEAAVSTYLGVTLKGQDAFEEEVTTINKDELLEEVNRELGIK